MTDTRLAADIGGTFTDIVLDVGGRRFTHKQLTTSDAPEIGLLAGVDAVLASARISLSDVNVLTHGTTLATNAIIERRGARTALVATEGFRDVLEIGTESRFDQYDLYLEKPVPLVPRELRLTIRERMSARGEVYIPLDEPGVGALAEKLRRLEVESVAIALINAYRNPDHERRVAELLGELLPNVTITVASEVCPEVREYERTSTAVANAYVQPIMAGYLGRMATLLEQRAFAGGLYLVTSGGGLTSLQTACKFPVRLVESGPAGGAIFAAQIAARADEARVLSFDMGGTTAKICLVEDGMPSTSRMFEVDRTARFRKGSGLPLKIPVIELVEIGAGGGSIARVDSLKRTIVGPASAGSEPGPACYGRGGAHPTVTDADLVLGLIDPEVFAGGAFKLHQDRSNTALASSVGNPLGMSPAMSAFAVYETVCENMASAARAHAAERGAALSRHTMIAFGGAAPLHAARVAEKIGIHRVVIPVHAGVGSAIGFLTAPVSYEIVRSFPARLDAALDLKRAVAMLDAMAAEAHRIVAAAAAGRPLGERRFAFMRYQGQGHEIPVRISSNRVTAEDVVALRESFEKQYAQQFSRTVPYADIEIMTWAVQVSTEHEIEPQCAAPVKTAVVEPHGARSVFRGEDGVFYRVNAYSRQQLTPGDSLMCPCVIVEDETTTFVPPGFDAYIDGAQSIVMVKRV